MENINKPIPVRTNNNKIEIQNTTTEAMINIHTLLATATTAASIGIKKTPTTAIIVRIAKAIARFFTVYFLKLNLTI